jgi:AcrR family transcriptional regulator
MTSTTQEAPTDGGLRERKKLRTRIAIQDAALELFIEKGFDATTVDEIAERAEVSKATFFRYFGTKGDVIFGNDGYENEDLRHAIIARPTAEDDLEAVARAIREEWVPSIDPRRVARQTKAASTSPLVRGLSFDLGMRWQAVISEALAVRHGLAAPDAHCQVVASLVFTAFSRAVNHWVHEAGARGDLRDELDRAFAEVLDVCRNVRVTTR